MSTPSMPSVLRGPGFAHTHATNPVEPPPTETHTVTTTTTMVAPPADGMDQTRAAAPAAPERAVEPKAPSGGGSKEAVDEANKEAMTELKKYNAFELMKMVRSGNIPEKILENPVAMNLMLERVQDFSRMIQLMTNMMQVQHETLTAIIRNIKA